MNEFEQCRDSLVRRNLLTRPGYSPYCGHEQCSHGMPRTNFSVDDGQFRCPCGWVSSFPADFIAAYRKFRIDSQVCSKCGSTVGNNKAKYCGDGSDKENAHRWVMPKENR